MKKIRTGTMLYPKIIRLCDNNINKANVKSRNDFIAKAIEHYAGYLQKDDNINYLNKVIDDTLRSKITLLEQQISNSFFKLAVEVSVLTNIIAITTDIDIDTLKKVRIKSMNDVKRTVGKIDLEEIFKSYSREEGD